MNNFTHNEVLHLAKTIEDENPDELIVPERLQNPDYLITKYKDNAKPVEEFRTGITRLLGGVDNLSIEVTKSTFKRSLKIFNAFIRLAKARGHEVLIKDRKTIIVIRDQELCIKLREPNRVHDHLGRNGWNERKYSSSGELSFRYERWSTEKEWRDAKKVKIEEKLAVIMAFLELKAEEEIRYEEKAKINQAIRLKEEELRKYKQEIFDKEKASYISLLDEANRWSKYIELRTYIDHATQNGSRSVEWIKWAKEKLEWLDPSTNTDDDILGDYAKFSDKYLKDRFTSDKRDFWF
jgi:hypothetical protein